MESRRLLIVALLLTIGILLMVNGVAQSFAVNFLIGLAFVLLGSIFWLQGD